MATNMTSQYYGPAFGPGYVPPTPMSSSTNQNAANYRVPASSTNTSTNFSGNTVYANTPSGSVLGASTQSGTQSQPSQPSQSPPPSTYFDASTGRTFNNIDDYYREIDSAYSGSENYLNEAERAVREDYPSALAEAEAQHKTSSSQLDNSRQSAFDTLNQQTTKATQTKESAMEAARRLHQEQQIGANQRFGGSTSAGQAASELQNREFFRNYGQTVRQHTDLVNQIETQRASVDREYQTGLLQLEQQKQTAINNANRDFQNKLLQISSSRAQLGQAKAEARLAALQELRNQVFAIEQQNIQFQQTLELQRQQAQAQLGNFAQVATGAQNTATNAVNSYNPTISNTTAATGGMYPSQSGQPLTGSIKREEENPLMGVINTGFQNFVDPFLKTITPF